MDEEISGLTNLEEDTVLAFFSVVAIRQIFPQSSSKETKYCKSFQKKTATIAAVLHYNILDHPQPGIVPIFFSAWLRKGSSVTF
jgi:hypothetical protein